MAHIQNTICRTKPWTSGISETSVRAFTLRNFCHLCLTLLVLRHLPYSQFLREKVITDRSSSLGRITEEKYCVYGWWLPRVFSEWTQKHDPRELGSKQEQKEPVSPTFFTEDNEKKNSVKDTYFEMPHNAQIFAAYTAVMPLSYIVPLSLQEALKFYAILLESTWENV